MNQGGFNVKNEGSNIGFNVSSFEKKWEELRKELNCQLQMNIELGRIDGTLEEALWLMMKNNAASLGAQEALQRVEGMLVDDKYPAPGNLEYMKVRNQLRQELRTKLAKLREEYK